MRSGGVGSNFIDMKMLFTSLLEPEQPDKYVRYKNLWILVPNLNFGLDLDFFTKLFCNTTSFAKHVFTQAAKQEFCL